MNKNDLKFIPDFYDRYISLVDDSVDLLDGLIQSKNIFESVSDELVIHEDYSYEPGKWTPKGVLQHVIDNERIMAYRALCISRGDVKTLNGYEENLYVENSNANLRTIQSLLEEFALVRESSIILFENFTDKMLYNTGVCSDIKVSTLALGLVIIGHSNHHLKVLRERYFSK